ncbi:hypothetical protein [Rhizobium rhododendri]|uniref:Uncharacterized protein n=1 Tax=Rhizobium rhododendri TaxID=2506430 RepID=A0ABY8IQA7_9HYPH|nr:hypothetical protein [Rhizobium rhododendri]WFS25343.1 hypothetical protein PR018_24275 [Rhizobium rhododendri]
MPYFLVTHTSLIEADDEATAAAKVYGEMCKSETLTFNVKADENPGTKVIVPTCGGTDPSFVRPGISTSSSTATQTLAITSPAPAKGPINIPVGQSGAAFRSTSTLLCAGTGIAAALYLVAHYLT